MMLVVDKLLGEFAPDIENELSYPGVIEITVIREQRFNETAV